MGGGRIYPSVSFYFWDVANNYGRRNCGRNNDAMNGVNRQGSVHRNRLTARSWKAAVGAAFTLLVCCASVAEAAEQVPSSVNPAIIEKHFEQPEEPTPPSNLQTPVLPLET